MAATIRVSTAAQLTAALRTARGGETILLAPGNYGNVSIINRDFTAPVTLKSANPARDAVFSELRIHQSSNIFIDDVEIGRSLRPGEALWTQPAYISSSHNLGFIGVTVHGSLDNNAWNDGWGLRFSDVRNVSVINSTFRQLNIAIHTEHSSNLLFSGNKVSEVREGFDFNSSHYVTLAGNSFTAFQPWIAYGDHPDSIQVWNYGANEGSSHFLIRDNVMLQGNNGTQGIFVRAEDPNPAYRHSDFVVENNLYSGASRLGISLSGVDGATIRDNTVTTSPAGNPGWDAAILLTDTSAALVERNISPLILRDNDRGTVLHDNVKLWDMNYRVGTPLAELFVNPGGSLYDPGNFAVRPGSIGVHAGFTLPLPVADHPLTALFTHIA